jgi:hypothetical protein
VNLDDAMTGGVDMDSIVIGQYMSITKHAHVNWLWLGSGKIGGLLRLDEAEFGQRDAPYHSFDAPGLEVSGSLTMLMTIFVDANMRDAKIGGDLSLAGAKQHDKRLTQDRTQNELTPLPVDLTGASIGHALILGNRWYGPVQWRPNAHVSLRNATVREVEG